MLDFAKVTHQLEAEGVAVETTGAPPELMWSSVFDVDGRKQLVVIFPNDDEYLTIVAPIKASKLRGPLEHLPSRQLAALIRAASQVRLAKLEYYDAAGNLPAFFAAASDCSVDGHTGKKLQRRMSACAQLAARIETMLGERSTAR